MSRIVIPAEARTWVEGADGSDFPIQNLPWSIGLLDSGDEDGATPYFRIGDQAVCVAALVDAGLLEDRGDEEPLGDFLRRSRSVVADLLMADNPRLRDDAVLRALALVPADGVEHLQVFSIGQFVDFYSGIYHAGNVGRMFRPDQDPLLPNYRWLPVGYNGRANTVMPTGTPITRPNGQRRSPDGVPSWGPSRQLDFELELGFFTDELNQMGHPAPLAQCEAGILGVTLLNDWSARDLQAWEYQPLGPFLAKSFATSVSPWVVSLDALEPFRVQGMDQDPEPLPYLRQPEPRAYDIHLEVLLQTERMTQPQVIARSNARHLYWSFAQQLAHQASNGTPVAEGDLYGTGTISGPDPGSEGSMLELTWRGERPLVMEETGETRTFLEDGDTLILRGWCQGEGYRIGFGECRGSVLPAPPFP